VPTILVVDDVQTDRELIGKVVQATGHHPEYAADGDEAFDKAKSLKPALVLLDVVMPKQDGFATCRKLKKDPDTAQIPVVLVTSKNTDTDRFWAEKQGSNGFIVKPFTPDELSRVIRKFVS
jgi:twitching motility two-component system response regulator PilH